MSNYEHFNTQELLDYADLTADAALQARIREHLAGGCSPCAEKLQEWSRITDILEEDRPFSVPENLRQSAFALFRPREILSGECDIVHAVVSFDSRTAPKLSETRNSLHDSFRLICEAGAVKVDLLCEHHSNVWTVAGGIVSGQEEGRTWSITCSGAAGEFETDLEDGFEFVFEDLIYGSYRLSLTSRTLQICLPSLDLPSTHGFLN